ERHRPATVSKRHLATSFPTIGAERLGRRPAPRAGLGSPFFASATFLNHVNPTKAAAPRTRHPGQNQSSTSCRSRSRSLSSSRRGEHGRLREHTMLNRVPSRRLLSVRRPRAAAAFLIPFHRHVILLPLP